MLRSWVEIGDILVGKLTHQMVKESSYATEDSFTTHTCSPSSLILVFSVTLN